ncbi:MAG: polysaccharide deacetylase family protein [Candidatus Nanopelagicales bacterium]
MADWKRALLIGLLMAGMGVPVSSANAASLHAYRGSGMTQAVALGVPVLEYHRFIPADIANAHIGRYDVSPALFSQQLSALAAAGWHTITASQLATDLSAGITPPARSFVITIDDGHEDGFSEALPVLRAHGMVATYFVVTGRIGEQRVADPSMTPEQLAALQGMGMEIGNHTVDHPHLAALSVPEQVREIEEASAQIARWTGVRPITMAYPFGSFSAITEAAAQRAHIMLAFDSRRGACERWSAHFASPRLRVGSQDSPEALVRRLGRLSRCGLSASDPADSVSRGR